MLKKSGPWFVHSIVHIILCAKFVWNWPVDSREFTNVALYSSCFVSSLVEIGPVVSREDENVMTGRRIENGQQVWEKLTLSYIYIHAGNYKKILISL